jgi:NACalpha-BTF3-like transcription factor
MTTMTMMRKFSVVMKRMMRIRIIAASKSKTSYRIASPYKTQIARRPFRPLTSTCIEEEDEDYQEGDEEEDDDDDDDEEVFGSDEENDESCCHTSS